MRHCESIRSTSFDMLHLGISWMVFRERLKRASCISYLQICLGKLPLRSRGAFLGDTVNTAVGALEWLLQEAPWHPPMMEKTSWPTQGLRNMSPKIQPTPITAHHRDLRPSRHDQSSSTLRCSRYRGLPWHSWSLQSLGKVPRITRTNGDVSVSARADWVGHRLKVDG